VRAGLYYIILLLAVSYVAHAQLYRLPASPFNPGKELKANSGRFIVLTDSKDYRDSGGIVPFDFDSKALIGISGSCSACSLPIISLEIWKNDKEKEYEIRATVTTEGSCRRNNHYYLLLECEKPDPSYKIETSFKLISL